MAKTQFLFLMFNTINLVSMKIINKKCVITKKTHKTVKKIICTI